MFGGNNLYAVPAVAAAAADALFFSLGWPLLGMVAAVLVGSIFTILASWRRWVLPEVNTWTISMTHKQWRALQKLRKERGGSSGSTEEPRWKRWFSTSSDYSDGGEEPGESTLEE